MCAPSIIAIVIAGAITHSIAEAITGAIREQSGCNHGAIEISGGDARPKGTKARAPWPEGLRAARHL